MESPKRWRLAHVGCSEPVYNKIFSDGCPSKPTTYTGLHPDGDPSGSLLKDGGSSTLDAQSQSIRGYTLIATLVDQQPIRIFTLMATP